MADTAFDFQKFLADSLQVLVNPSEYFSKMEKSGGLGDPIIRAVIYGTAAGLINFIWSILNLGPAGGWFGEMLGSGINIMALILTMIGSLIVLFIGGVVILILSAICSGAADFETSMRVMASTMVLIPLRSAIGIASGFTFYMGYIVTLLIAAYSMYLIYTGLVHALKGKQAAARIVTIVLTSIPVLMIIGSMMCVQKMRTMSNDAEDFMKNLPESNIEMKRKIERLKEKMKESNRNSL